MKLSTENDDDYLLISGIKHFRFCRRRWALVHLEQQWDENALTLDGHYMHERVHDDSFTEKRGSILLSRGMAVRSSRLKITGVCDMVELYNAEEGVRIHGRDGQWNIYPVEYKHGAKDERGADELQLCAQVMCLEEMFATDIAEGAIYYGKTHHRLPVSITDALRSDTEKAIAEMQALWERAYTPKAKWTKACKSCSLVEVCQPKLSKQIKASEYIKRTLEEELR